MAGLGASSQPFASAQGAIKVPWFGLSLIIALFFMWGMANNLNDVLIAQFKKAFELSDFQSGLVQSAFYLGYFCLAIPASIVMRKAGFRSGIIVGLLLYAAGAFLFVPAANAQSYSFFLFALFVIASGLAFLETSANPFIAALGPSETADRRLNFAQAFNPLGSVTGVLLGKYLIFSDEALTESDKLAMTPAALDAYLTAEVQAVKGPYVAIGVVVLIWALLVAVAKFPVVTRGQDFSEQKVAETSVRSLFSKSYINLWFGVIAQFFYVGAQVGIWSYLIRYTQFAEPGTSERVASNYLLISLVLLIVGRFVGSAAMIRFKATHLLTLFALINVILTCIAALIGGQVGLWALVATSFFMSIMFPSIFSISLRGLDSEMKSASSLLVMSIIGGAILTALMGWVSDITTIYIAMVVPMVSFAIIMGFALRANSVAIRGASHG